MRGVQGPCAGNLPGSLHTTPFSAEATRVLMGMAGGNWERAKRITGSGLCLKALLCVELFALVLVALRDSSGYTASNRSGGWGTAGKQPD